MIPKFFGFFFFKILFIYLSERERAHKQGERQAEGEAGSLPSKEPNEGLDPRTLGSRPKPKADAQLTEPPRCPSILLFKKIWLGTPGWLSR